MKLDSTAAVTTATTGLLTGSHDLLINGVILPLLAGVIVPFLKDWTGRLLEKRRSRKQAKNEQ